jgi:adenylosuccinate lyase
MTSRFTESEMYRHSWTTPALDEILSEDARLRTWLRILATLAECQAGLGIIPAAAAAAIAEDSQSERLDLEAIAARTRESSHSVLGLIEGLQGMLPDQAREYVYYGITVQDLTDTWFGIVMRDVTAILRADLLRVKAACLRLAHEHRDTVMAGRTHGQIGSPITFGLKAATWADEASRNIDRLDEGVHRWAVAQLAGSTGGLAFFGEHGPPLRALFSAALSLGDPGISWTSTRDRTAEFGATLGLVTGALARIGNEIYELQRPEIAELSEPINSAVVGSITMPHKRNPEYCEHLDTLSRVARAAAGGLLEGTTASHERDGRAWKAEWAFLPDVALAAGTAASLCAELLEGLVVHPDAMLRNLSGESSWASEQVLVQLSVRLGKHRAQALLQAAFAVEGTDAARTIAESAAIDVADVRAWMSAPQTATATAMADAAVVRLGSRPR